MVGRRHRHKQELAPDPEALHTAVIRELEQGHGRRAGELLQRARRAHVELPDAAVLAYCSRRARQEELRRAGMHKEAADLCAAPVDPGSLAQSSETGRALYLLYAPPQEAAAAGPEARASTPAVLQAQVDRWMVAAEAEPAETALPAQVGAARQAMQAARRQMRAGAWSAAAEALSGVDRRSPLAAWRLLGRAMAAQAGGAPEEAARNARQAAALAPNFILAPALAALMGEAAPPPEGTAAARRRHQVREVLRGEARLLARAQALLPQIRQPTYDSRRWRREIQAVAREICPEQPQAAVRTLFLLLQVDLVRSDRGSWRLRYEAAAAPIPGRGHDLRAHLMLLGDGMLDLADDDNIEIWEQLKQLLDLGAFGQLVQAQLRIYLARLIGGLEADPEMEEAARRLASRVIPRLGRALPLSIQLLQAAIALDPEDLATCRAADRALLEEDTPLAHGHRIKLLKKMQRALPHDTYAYLALARELMADEAPLRALELLEKASAFAGQDLEVNNLTAIAHAHVGLESAAKSPAAALRQLARSSELCRGELRPFLQIARLAAQVTGGAMNCSALEEALMGSPPGGRLRVVALVRCLSHRLPLQRRLAGVLRRAAKGLESEAAMGLLAPVPDDVALLFGDAAPVVAGLAPVLGRVLALLTPTELLTSATQVLAGGGGSGSAGCGGGSSGGSTGDRALRAEVRSRQLRCKLAVPVEVEFLALFLDLRKEGSPQPLVDLVELTGRQDAVARARLAAAAANLSPLAPTPARPLLSNMASLSALFDQEDTDARC